jgi:hypothetical protein
MVDIQTLSVVIAAASVVVGVVTFIMNSRKEEKQRQEQFILQRFQGYGLEYTRSWTEVMTTLDWENVEEFIQKYDRNVNPEFSSKLVYVLGIWNLAGISLKRGADPDLIFQMYNPSGIILLWELYEPIIKWVRKASNDPIAYESLEYFYNEAKERFSETQRPKVELDTTRFKSK